MPKKLTGEELKERLRQLENASRKEQLIACGYWCEEDGQDYGEANIEFCSELQKIDGLNKAPFNDIEYKEGEDYRE